MINLQPTCNQKTYKLDYVPKGFIVVLNFEKNKIITDTLAVFEIINTYSTKIYKDKTKDLLLTKIKESKNDTISFSGQFSGRLIPFRIQDNIIYQYWATEYVIFELLKKNKLKIIDKFGNNVKNIKTKKIGSKIKGYKAIAYINLDSYEELFRKTIYMKKPGIRFH